MNKTPTDNHGRAQKVPSTEYPTDATMPERVPGADEASRNRGRNEGESVREQPRNRQGDGPTPQPPLGGERADNGSD